MVGTREGIDLKSLAIPFVAVTWLLSAAPALASSVEIGPTDDAAQPCINAYYGIGEVVDYAKAYKCFESLKVYQFMVLMQLNGQGVPASAAKAKEIMDEWRKANPNYTDEVLVNSNRRIAELLKKKTIDVPVSPKLDYCNDVASFGFEWRFCSSLDSTLSEQSTNQEFAKIRAKLSSKDVVIWDAVMKSFADYVQTEGNRGEDRYAGGSMAAQGYDDQQIYVRNSFLHFAQSSFIDMKLEPASKDVLATSEKTMNDAYNEAIAHYENTDEIDDTDSELTKTEADYLDQAKSNLDASQKTWLVLRNQCEELAKRIYNEKTGVDWGVSARNALTLVRAADIKQATVE